MVGLALSQEGDGGKATGAAVAATAGRKVERGRERERERATNAHQGTGVGPIARDSPLATGPARTGCGGSTRDVPGVLSSQAGDGRVAQASPLLTTTGCSPKLMMTASTSCSSHSPTLVTM